MVSQSFRRAFKKTAGRVFAAIALLSPWCARAAVLTVKNFDEDLATVYVNDTVVGHDGKVDVSGEVKIELKDFRNEYYFRCAPASQLDRSLALESWEGLPDGYATKNPAVFNVDSDLTVTVNVDVKGYCWYYEEIDGVQQITNNVYRWRFGDAKDDYRSMRPGAFLAMVEETSENNLVLDFVERVRYKGKNYTLVEAGTSWETVNFSGSRMGTWSLPHRFSRFGANLANGSDYLLTKIYGAYDIKTCIVQDMAFGRPRCYFDGPATNFVPRNLTAISSWAYQGCSKMTGELLLEQATGIYGAAFNGCNGISSLRILSPNLQVVKDSAFNCTGLKEVIFGASLAQLTTLDATAFRADIVTNFVFAAEPPAATLIDNLLSKAADADGAHDCRLTVDPTISAWWNLTALPTDAEIAAGLPADCIGVYVAGSGERRAWMIADGDLDGILLVGDMTMTGNNGFVPQVVTADETVELTAPAGYDVCQLQHWVDGKWTTFDTKNGSTIGYTHDGKLTRAVWSVDGVTLQTAVNAYNGTIAVELVSGRELVKGIYAKDSVVQLTATGAAEHPTSRFAGWIAGVDAGAADSNVIELRLTEDTAVSAAFLPNEWLYANNTLTDGEWTMNVTETDGEITVTKATGGQNGLLLLDLSLPVYNASEPEAQYTIGVLATSPQNMRRLKVGTHFRAIVGGEFMRGSTMLERIDGLGDSQLTAIPYAYLYDCASAPFASAIYEANDYLPPGLLSVGDSMGAAPYLTGSLEFNAATTFPNFWSFRSKFYKETVDGEVVGVTNLLLTAEGLEDIPANIFSTARLSRLTIGSTNLLTVANGAFANYDGRFKELVFLAHAPAVEALDTIVKLSATTNMTIYCSKYAPGWKALRVDGWQQKEEWAARPAGCWGIYQTADGQKRYYLVQQDSKYDERKGFTVFVK